MSIIMLLLSLIWNLRGRSNKMPIYLGDQRKRSLKRPCRSQEDQFPWSTMVGEAVFTGTVKCSNNKPRPPGTQARVIPSPALEEAWSVFLSWAFCGLGCWVCLQNGSGQQSLASSPLPQHLPGGHLSSKGWIVRLWFPSHHVRMWDLGHKEGWAQGVDAFELWCWRRPLRVPWTARRSNQSILKETNLKYSLEGLMWNSLTTWCEELAHWKRPWCWEKLKQEKREAEDERVR